jgi:hypothetical protein
VCLEQLNEEADDGGEYLFCRRAIRATDYEYTVDDGVVGWGTYKVSYLMEQ